MSGKVCIIGGGGVRTPLLIHGLLQSQNILKISELVLFDVSHEGAEVMAALGREIASNMGVDVRLTTTLLIGSGRGGQHLRFKQRAHRRHGCKGAR